MKLLLLHCDYFSFLVTEPTKAAEEIQDGCKSCAIKDVLVIFVTVEKGDGGDPNRVINKGVEEIVSYARRLGVRNLVVFPFVHLSNEISTPEIAARIIEGLYEGLKSLNYSVSKAPFGWEKIFSMTSKGHPLAVSLKTVRL